MLSNYVDLDFVVGELKTEAAEIPKTFIYCNNIAMGTEIIDHLTKLLPPHLQLLGLMRPCNASSSNNKRPSWEGSRVVG